MAVDTNIIYTDKDLGKNLADSMNNFKYKPVFKLCDLTNIQNLQKIILQIKNEIDVLKLKSPFKNHND